MNIFTDHIFEWAIFLLGLLLLIYTMIAIKEEKVSFKENTREVLLESFTFFIPSWWTETHRMDESLRFERTDTRYDWNASFVWSKEIPPHQNIEEQFVERLSSMRVEFDGDTSIVHDPEHFKDHPYTKEQGLSIVRMEGTATIEGVERAYLDAFLIRTSREEHNGYLWAISHSSILNGLVEGPYFEDVMLNFKYENK